MGSAFKGSLRHQQIFISTTCFQSTFSNKGIEMTFQLHISKFEILSSFNEIKKIFIAFSVQKSVCHGTLEKKSLFLWILMKKLRISNFEMSCWMSFLFLSQ